MQEPSIAWTTQRICTEARSTHFLILVDGTGDAAFAVDAFGRIRAWNNAAAELFGRSEAEAVGVSCHELLQCSDENGIICSEHCVVERAAHDRRPLESFDLRVQTKSGRLWCNLSALNASDSGSRAHYTIYIVRPVETRKRLEQALSEFIRTHARNGYHNSASLSPAPKPRVEVSLTSREVEVLKNLAKGLSTKAIANQLNISSATVNNHIKHILRKLDAHTRLEAIRHAESVGVI
jgi:PAS domain S-box-containing protein